jgi:protocatechuate 4,5-dioxygenase alpha chain
LAFRAGHDWQIAATLSVLEVVPMARESHDYDDIPGTTVFDASRAREGYPINSFCMSLMKDQNRKAFKADEAGYIKQFHMTPEQEKAILTRDYNKMLELGGNIYFTAKLGATDGHSFQHLAAVMTGSTQQSYADMMLGGGRHVDGNRSRDGKHNKPALLTAEADAEMKKAARSTGKAGAAKSKSKSKTSAKKRK